ncbi:MAG: BamA/TamA family outer membrane protein [Proteobacteria bacterium]|nr:BamA/TamA family outer membrane protein [Pseudomonadota bacterium]
MTVIFKKRWGSFYCGVLINSLWLLLAPPLAVAEVVAASPVKAEVTAAEEEEKEAREVKFKVVGLTTSGLVRTNLAWLNSYIDYQFPADLTQSDLAELERKLTTTAIFTQVKVSLEPRPGPANEFFLRVEAEERWTTIPVVRGAYGGGIPMRVLGFYDINLLGRLLTFGAEARQFGASAPGFVVYGRDPRGNSDRYYVGEEFWREFRRRQVFDRKGRQLGQINSDMAMNRLRLLLPIDNNSGAQIHPWRVGGDIELVKENPSSFEASTLTSADTAAPPGIFVRNRTRFLFKLLPTVVFNDIHVDQIQFQGSRLRVRAGPVVASGKTASIAEIEGYYFSLIGPSWNLAMRTMIGASTIDSLQSEYFLGGLDTVRGIPDSVLYGTHAGYTNVELRHMELKSKYLWLQSAAFVDAGAAGASWQDAGTNGRVSAGIGMRFSVPQVYRLMLRIDYAWSLVGPQTQGVTLGLNQFFDALTPL